MSGGFHCIRDIQIKAEESSGITADQVYKIDEVDLIEKLGETTFITLCGVFYDKIYRSEILKHLFQEVEKDDMTHNMYEFLIERFGGPKYYSDRKGTPALFNRHQDVIFTEVCIELFVRLHIPLLV
jgi:truncated hemoglobin YjbI